MEIPISRIGNSKGIRLSKMLLDKYKIRDRVEIILEQEQIIIRPVSEPRKGWDKAFREMHENGDDKLLISDVFDDENPDEWN